MIDIRWFALVAACLVGAGGSVQEAYSPARYRSGAVPTLPALAVGGGQVILELTVNVDGRVDAVTALRTTPPFTDLVMGAVRDWQFFPAEKRAVARGEERESRTAVPSRVLVAAVFRPPAINAPTLGEIPRDVAAVSEQSPFPLALPMPAFPPSAAGSGVVLLEARVDGVGRVADASVIRSEPPFDDASRAAINEWRFRPARAQATPASTFVYVLFGFPVPVGIPPATPRDGRP